MRVNAPKENLNLLMLIGWIFSGILLGISRGLDDAIEVMLNDTASVNCYSNKSVKIQWHLNSFLNRLYAGGIFRGSCKDRCLLESDNEGSIILKIPKVKVEDAGLYFCSEESSGKQIGSTDLTILYSSPQCYSNMNPDGFIGPNTCNLKQERMIFNCSVSFNGRAPHLTWRSLSNSQSFNNTVCTNEPNRRDCSLILESNPLYDASIFICQTATSSNNKFNCTTEFLKVQYLLTNNTIIDKKVHTTETCTLRSNLNVQYKWTSKQNEEDAFVSSNRVLLFERPGLYQCDVEYSIRNFSCFSHVSTVNVSGEDSDKTATTSATLTGILFSFIILIVAITLLIYLEINRRRNGSRGDSHENEMKSLIDSDIDSDPDNDTSENEWKVLSRIIASSPQLLRESDQLGLNHFFNVNVLTPSSQTLLHLLCYLPLKDSQLDLEEYRKSVTILIDKGVDVNHKDAKGKTALILACEKRCTYMIRALVGLKWKTLDIDAIDSSGESAFTIAGRNKDHNVFTRLISVLFLQAVNSGNMSTVTRIHNLSTEICARRFQDLCVRLNKHRFLIDSPRFQLQSDPPIDARNALSDVDIEHPPGSCITFYDWFLAIEAASNRKHEAMVQLLLRMEKFDANVQMNEEETALHFACRCKDDSLIKWTIELLLRHKVNVHQRNYRGQTALMIACENENVVSVCELLKWSDIYGVTLDINAKDDIGQTALSLAYQSNNAEIAAMIEHKLFLRAVESGDKETVKSYMKRLNENSQIEQRPINMQCAEMLENQPSKKSESLSETSRSRRIRPKYEISHTRSATNAVSANDVPDKVQLMSVNSITHSVFLEGVYMAYCKSGEDNSHNDILKLLLNIERYMHEYNEEGQTILHSAVQEYLENKCEPKGLRKIQILLISCECNVNALNTRNETVLHLVCRRKANENLLLDDLLKILLKYRVDLNLRNNLGETALLIACKNGNTNIVRTLLTLTRNNDIYLDVDAYDKSDADETVNNKGRFGQMSSFKFEFKRREKKWRQTYSFDSETLKEAVHVAIEISFEEILKFLLDYDVFVQRQYGRAGDTNFTHSVYKK